MKNYGKMQFKSLTVNDILFIIILIEWFWKDEALKKTSRERQQKWLRGTDDSYCKNLEPSLNKKMVQAGGK